nr:hypothetical protein [Kibdelosporangium sp. MJ126-NF4]CEL22310.1 hypothetical protein [Kibdelosporangium sp. MJ126-NF4]CTQ93090.1 hypothetical protein [Kibdelosporangium sp. MJ126-NF4]
MNRGKRIRQIHRWLAIAFTATVVFTSVALTQEDPAAWVSYVPLFPLAFLMVTGLCMFVLPYTAKWRRGRVPAE